MSIRDWSKEFASGYTIIDNQHKELFQLCNALAKNPKADEYAMIKFLEDLTVLFITHFETENKAMQEYKYPLAEYHTNEHNSLQTEARRLRQQLIAGRLHEPHKKLVAFASDYINQHVANEDSTFYRYLRNRNYNLGDDFVGRRCEVLNMDNKSLGIGRIDSVVRNDVEIANLSSQKIPVRLNDTVKISSFSSKKESQTFVAKVYYSTDKLVRLFNATIIQSSNDRRFIRVLVSLSASMRTDDGVFPASVVDLSLGGMMVRSEAVLAEGDEVLMDFTLLDKGIKQRCRVMRASIRGDEPNVYGLQFTSMRIYDSDKIHAYIFSLQTAARKKQ